MTKRNQSGQAGQQQAVALEDANELQQQMMVMIKANHETTSKHNTAIKRLTIAIVVFTAVIAISTVLSSCNQTGRYTISSVSERTTYVLDTKTSQVWLRTLPLNIYMGTNGNPEHKSIK